MSKNETSTPLSDDKKDTFSSSKTKDNLSFIDELDSLDEKPLVTKDEADVKKENELIFGKFKTIEEAHKSYKEAEKAITKSAELEKQLKLYQEEAKLYEQDKVARDNGFKSRWEMALREDVWHYEVDDYAMAASRFLPAQQRLEIKTLIDRCHRFGVNDDLARLRRYFTPEVVAMVSQDTAMFKNSRMQEYEEMSRQDKNVRNSRKLGDFRRLNINWIDSDIKKELFEQALDVSDGNVDLLSLKEIVEKIEEDAISKYLKKKNVQQETASLQNSLIEPNSSETPKSKKKTWLTKAEYYKLSPKEEAEKYDLIVEQVMLEKKGLLPRMLT